MDLDQHRYDSLVSTLSEAVDLVGQSVALVDTDRLRTAREWLRRSRRLIRQAQEILELEIMDRDDEREGT
jgi:hypothetical protein